MKTLYLLRHAKSSWKNTGLADYDRPLSKRGRRAAACIGREMAARGITPGQILCSPASRTRETLDLVQTSLESAIPIRYEKAIYLAEAPALLRRLRRLSDALSSVMLVGHNPGLETLVVMLMGSSEAGAREAVLAKYPTGALAILSADVEHWRDLAPGNTHLAAFLRPKDLGEE